MAKNKDEKEFERNRPSEEGRKNDPVVRDYSAIQPGVNTISSSDTDHANQEISRTASDNFRPNKDDEPPADKRFDD
ncbi:MAG TPA: hypothetical protein VFR58_11155 [Flavisolibacter sp.]|nr:hypothetical protein [Flavisolibacter sp.]